MDRWWRDLDLRLCRVLRPLRVRMRLRKPWRRLRTRRLERAMVGRGPQRIWTPPKRGLALMAVRGTMSTTPASREVAADEAGLGVYRPAGVLLLFWPERKTVEEGRGAARLGRSVGSDVKVLRDDWGSAGKQQTGGGADNTKGPRGWRRTVGRRGEPASSWWSRGGQGRPGRRAPRGKVAATWCGQSGDGTRGRKRPLRGESRRGVNGLMRLRGAPTVACLSRRSQSRFKLPKTARSLPKFQERSAAAGSCHVPTR